MSETFFTDTRSGRFLKRNCVREERQKYGSRWEFLQEVLPYETGSLRVIGHYMGGFLTLAEAETEAEALEKHAHWVQRLERFREWRKRAAQTRTARRQAGREMLKRMGLGF